jgi:hypothetical protein
MAFFPGNNTGFLKSGEGWVNGQPSYMSENERLFTDPEHLGAANRANALSCRLTIFHLNGLGILDFSLGAALYTISLHRHPSLFFESKDKSFPACCQEGTGVNFEKFLKSDRFLGK